MRIAMMVRGYITAPHPADIIYAPIDLALAIGDGLAQRGHDVDFYGPNGTELKYGRAVPTTLRPLVHSQSEFTEMLKDIGKQTHYVPNLWDMYFVQQMFQKANRGFYDILHFHHPEIALSSASLFPKVPIAYTLHDPIFPWYKELFELYHSPNQHFISISDNQRRDASDLPYCKTVYNGVDLKKYPFSDKHEDYLIFAGRIIPEKGVKEAIQVAQETKNRLLIIGPVYEDHKEYFDQYIKPHLNDKILYLGYMEPSQLVKYYQKAKAFLMPVQWEEPFGLTMIESMACGTPVIALNRGSIPEVVADGKTGFVVNSVSEMVDAVKKIDEIDRKACHKHVKDNFTIDHMIDVYEKTFMEILRATRPSTRIVKSKLRGIPKKLQTGLKKYT